jgi:hypothetical protein
MYITIIEALKKKERKVKTQFTTKIDGFLNPPHPRMPMFLVIFG